jgi:hypothetical protein
MRLFLNIFPNMKEKAKNNNCNTDKQKSVNHFSLHHDIFVITIFIQPSHNLILFVLRNQEKIAIKFLLGITELLVPYVGSHYNNEGSEPDKFLLYNLDLFLSKPFALPEIPSLHLYTSIPSSLSNEDAFG